MNRKFYVDINALNSYATFLKSCVTNINHQITLINRANVKYQESIKDDISKQVGVHIVKLKKVFDNFTFEVNEMSKQVKKDNELYSAYLKNLK